MPGGKNAGSKAAQAQTEGIEKGIEEQRRQYEQSRQDIAPFRFAGLVALRQLMGGEMGLPYYGGVQFDPDSGEISIGRTGTNVDATAPVSGGTVSAPPTAARQAGPWQPGTPIPSGIPASMIVPEEDNSAIYRLFAMANEPPPAAPADPAPQVAPVNLPDQGPLESGFKATPGYEFRLNEGIKALERGAAAKGRLFSGRQGKDLVRFGQEFGSNEYGNYYNRLASLAGLGPTATNQQTALGQNTANNIAQMHSNIGAAQASGQIADANARASGFNSLLGLGVTAATGGFGGFGAGAAAGYGTVGRTVSGLPWLT